jgi:hypothetical protein
MKKLTGVFLFSVCFLWGGCNLIIPATNNTPTRHNIEPTTSEISTPAQTKTPASQQVSGYQRTCLEVETTIPLGFLSKGAIILYRDDGVYSLTAEGFNLHFVSNNDQYPKVISPDGKWLALETNKKGTDGQITSFLEILSSDGLQHELIPFGQQWKIPFYWLDSKRMIIFTGQYRMVVIDVFTNQTTELDYSSPEFSINPSTIPRYDPMLTRMVFQRLEQYGTASLVLWDLQAGREVWQTEIRNYYYWMVPQWTADGNQFAVGFPPGLDSNSIYQLFIIDRDGRYEQVTNFHNPRSEIYGTQWSPNERYIAFWYGNSLTIYDTLTELSTDYCLPTDMAVSSQLYWSPDSQQIVFNLENEPDLDAYGRVVVVDVQQKKAVQIANPYLVIGWMTVLP